MIDRSSCKFMEQEIWKKGIALSKEVYKVARMLPPEELYELSSQLRRAATSIPSNVSEGYSRITTKEYLSFLSIARGSCAEVQTQLILCVELDFVSEAEIDVAFNLAVEEHKMLSATINSLSAKVHK